MGDLHPGQDKKAGVHRDLVEIGNPLLFRPSKIPVSRPDMAGSGREAHAGKGPSFREGDVFYVLAHRLGMAQVMVVLNKARIESLPRRAADHAKIDGREGRERTHNRGGIHCWLRWCASFRREPRKLPFFRRERDASLPVELEHEPPTDHVLERPVRLGPIPETAQFP